MNNAQANSDNAILAALTGFFPKVSADEFLVKKSAGFSGNAVYEIQLPDDAGHFCLKAARPGDVASGKLAWIHALLRHAGASISYVPIPLQTVQGKVCAQAANQYWELAPWMPGTADFSAQPTPERLRAAAIALAKFHRAAASFPAPDWDAKQPITPPQGPSSGVVKRAELCAQRNKSGWKTLESAVSSTPWPEFRTLATRFVQHAEWEIPLVLPNLLEAREQDYDLQPIIRDLWHDHVLFTGDEVTGIVDFDAVQMDARLLDLARLFADFAGRQDALWELAMSAYNEIWPLPAQQLACLRAVSLAGVILSGLTWIEWIAIEQRSFSEPDRVLQRFRQLLGNLSPEPLRNL